MDAHWTAILAAKPEVLSPIASRARFQAAAAEGRAAILELAGRDSVAAATAVGRERIYDYLLPTFAYTGTETGPADAPMQTAAAVAARLRAEGAGLTLGPLVPLGAPAFWRQLNGRYAAALARRFGFHSPCLACHLYFHALRIPLARALGCRAVVSGEREDHAGDVKINQTAALLDLFTTFMKEFDVELIQPVRRLRDNDAIAALAGKAAPDADLECAFAGNYRDAAGGALTPPADAVARFFEEFALPYARRVVTAWLAGEPVDYAAAAKDLWAT
jgi:hypothetical protein